MQKKERKRERKKGNGQVVGKNAEESQENREK